MVLFLLFEALEKRTRSRLSQVAKTGRVKRRQIARKKRSFCGPASGFEQLTAIPGRSLDVVEVNSQFERLEMSRCLQKEFIVMSPLSSLELDLV